MTTRVVNVRRGYDGEVVYIGRAMPAYGLPASIWANPYRIGPDGNREQVLDKYLNYLLKRPDLLARLPELRDRVLDCWCAPPGGLTAADPLVCHGQLLAEFSDREEVPV